MVQSALYGSRGITINHFDMLGNGVALDRDFGRGLREARPFLDALQELDISDESAEGVSVLFNPEAARFFQVSGSAEGLSAIAPHSVYWSRVLYGVGVTHRFCQNLEQCGDIVAVSGQTLRGFTDAQIEYLLRRSVLLDAGAAYVLMKKGFGPAIGLEGCNWRTLQESAYAYECIQGGAADVFGVANPRMSAQRCASRLLEMSPLGGTELLTTIHDATHTFLWPGAVSCQNSLGGTVVTVCYSLEPAAQFSMAFFNVFRRRFLQRTIFRMSTQVAAVEGHPMYAYQVKTSRGTLLAACNISDDAADDVVWAVPRGQFADCQWRLLTPEGTWLEIGQTRHRLANHDLLTFPHAVPALGEAVLLAYNL